MIVATQAKLHSGSTYQGMRSAESAVICDYLKGKMKYQVVSERQGKSFGELSPLHRTVSDGQRYSAATRNSVSGRTISRKAKSALDM